MKFQMPNIFDPRLSVAEKIRLHFSNFVADYWKRNPIEDRVVTYDDLIRDHELAQLSEAEKQELSSIAKLDDHLAYLRKPLTGWQDAEIRDELTMLADDPYSSRWEDLIDEFGESKLISLGANI